MAPIVSLRERVLRAFHADLPRLAIGLYFINACVQGIELWARGNGMFPWFRVVLLGPAAAMGLVCAHDSLAGHRGADGH